MAKKFILSTEKHKIKGPIPTTTIGEGENIITTGTSTTGGYGYTEYVMGKWDRVLSKEEVTALYNQGSSWTEGVAKACESSFGPYSKSI